MNFADKEAFADCLADAEPIQADKSKPVPISDVKRINHRQAAQVLRAVANEDRFRLLCRLAEAKATVTTLSADLRLPQPAVSQHLAKLRSARLVEFVQDQKHRVYSLQGASTLTLLDALSRAFPSVPARE